MRPHIIHDTTFDGDIAMDNYVKRNHNAFGGCYHPDGCGEITFMGDIVATTEVITSERPAKASDDWAGFINSMNQSGKKVWAIALTLIKKDERGLYKETVYVNNRYNSVIFYTSLWDRYGDTRMSRESYMLVSHILGPVLDALGIKY